MTRALNKKAQNVLKFSFTVQGYPLCKVIRCARHNTAIYYTNTHHPVKCLLHKTWHPDRSIRQA